MQSFKFVHSRDEANKDYFCPICKDFLIPTNSSQLMDCSHIYCTSCLESIGGLGLYDRITCPLCNVSSRSLRLKDANKFAYNALSSVEVMCPNEGCDEVLKIENLDFHQKYCDHKKVNCPYCPVKNIKKKDFKNHLKENMEGHFLQLIEEVEKLKKDIF